jgi:hypothetical protein
VRVPACLRTTLKVMELPKIFAIAMEAFMARAASRTTAEDGQRSNHVRTPLPRMPCLSPSSCVTLPPTTDGTSRLLPSPTHGQTSFRHMLMTRSAHLEMMQVQLGATALKKASIS